jgi:hypothetical protein
MFTLISDNAWLWEYNLKKKFLWATVSVPVKITILIFMYVAAILKHCNVYNMCVCVCVCVYNVKFLNVLFYM